MNSCFKYLFIFCFALAGLHGLSQNEIKKWYFGHNAGLDFMTNPPTILTNGALYTSEGSASISDAGGNLLFYTNGETVWNSAHAVMANGTGLFGNYSSTQSAVIVKQPGNSNIYYIFTVAAQLSVNGLRYSIVDMSLAAGMGAVTVKNVPLYSQSTEKLAAVKHCNGVDTWVVSHDWNTASFRTILVTAAGLSPAVITTIGADYSLYRCWMGCLKFSPGGKKMAVAISTHPSSLELFDFNTSTGVISNSLSLGWLPDAYGCEFSPDGTKFYATDCGQPNPVNWFITDPSTLYQWDLCAASPTDIAATKTALSTTSVELGSLQLGPDNKIYVARGWASDLGVINNPNVAGTGCTYIDTGQSIAPYVSEYGLPAITSGFFSPPPFTYTNSCQSVFFSAVALPTVCANLGPTLVNVLWSFGDPSSGTFNTSTLVNPAHLFSAFGTYTVQLIRYYTCSSDTVKQQVIVSQPCALVSGSVSCVSLGTATVTPNSGTGPFSYTWLPGGQTGQVANGLFPGTYTISIFDLGNNYTYTISATLSSTVPFTGNVSASNSLACNSVNTGTAAIIALSGGSGNQTFLWSNGLTSFTNSAPGTLGTGDWSVTVTDALTFCKINQSFVIGQPPPVSLSLSADTPTACVNTNIALSVTISGGTPAYTHTWVNGTSAPVYNVTRATAGIYAYTLNCSDANSCFSSSIISVSFVNTVTALSANNASICPLETGTLKAIGATNCTWTGPAGIVATGNTFTASPPTTQQYTITGMPLGCPVGTVAITVTVYVLPLPSPSITLLKPRVCLGEQIVLQGLGGLLYRWAGPDGYTFSGPGATITANSLTRGGTYTLLATNYDGCKDTAFANIIIDPLPEGSFSGQLQGCIPFCTDLELQPTPGTNTTLTASWQINGQNYSGTSFSVCFTNPGNYVITGSLKDELHQCINTSSFAVVHANPSPSAAFESSPKLPLAGFDEVFFTNTSTGINQVSWSWLFSDAKSYSNIVTPDISHLYTEAGTYSVTMIVKNTSGCEDIISKEITVGHDLGIYIPNAFTPNNDGLNETFYPVMNGVKLFAFSIYNRWGELLFSTKDSAAGWNGYHKGQPCKQDVYVWKLIVTNPDGEVKTLKGHVTLLRSE